MIPQFTADDWGLSQEINRGILSLAEKRKLQRVSVLMNGPECEFLLSELLATEVEFSVHLNFTEGYPLGDSYKVLTGKRGELRGLTSFYVRPYAYRILLSEMVREAFLQIEKAQCLFGNRLVEVDGHHHMHLYPGFLQKIKSTLLDHQIMNVRIPLDWEHPSSATMGAVLWLQRSSFRGLTFLKYGYFTPNKELKSKFQYYLCHPALGVQKNDPLKERRVEEYKRLVAL